MLRSAEFSRPRPAACRSWPAPAVVLQAVSHGAVAASPNITRTVASFLRIDTPSLRARNETERFSDGSIGAGSIGREAAQASTVNTRQRTNGLIVLVAGKKSLSGVWLFPNITRDLPNDGLHQVRGHKVGYRCYILDGENHIVQAHDLNCATDQEARARATCLLAHDPYYPYAEVWHGTRRVVKLERGEIQIKSSRSLLETRQSFGPTAA